MKKIPRAPFPEFVKRVSPDEPFTFACHPGVPCFTECCRLLELALTPYDVLRLRRGTGLSSQELLDQYIIEEYDERDVFPRFFLTMIDDGRASCAFITEGGCTLYAHRPGACRVYPLGRAAVRNCGGAMEEHFVLVKESHCQGFEEPKEQTIAEYMEEQGLNEYNRYNDAVATLVQHERIRQGFTPSAGQIELYTLALYNLDTFRELLKKNQLPDCAPPASVLDDDEQLLLFGVEWLKTQFFSAE